MGVTVGVAVTVRVTGAVPAVARVNIVRHTPTVGHRGRAAHT